MLKLKMIIKVLLAVAILLYFHPIANSIAGPCDENSSNASTPTCTGDYNCSENWNSAPELDPSNSDEMVPNSSIPLTVSGGCSPYIWSVSGEGFWFDAGHTAKTIETKGSTVTLYADSSACGAATISTTGCSGGTPEKGYVRSTTGEWAPDEDKVQVCIADTIISRLGNCCAKIEGKTKYISCLAVYEGTEECTTCPRYDCTFGIIYPPDFCGPTLTQEGWKRESYGDNHTLEWICPY